MARWDYKLKIKDLLFDKDELPDDVDYGKKLIEIAGIAADRIDEFMSKLSEDNDDQFQLWMAMEEVRDTFMDLSKLTPDTDLDPESEFNDALSLLYDVGDEHRVWIE